jgi:hypothetical protein
MNRGILTAAIFQHSSKVQPFKQESLDSIVERIIHFSKKVSLTTKDIQDNFVELIGYCIPIDIFENSIERLLKNRIVFVDPTNEEKYRINPARSSEIDTSEKALLLNQDKLINNSVLYL